MTRVPDPPMAPAVVRLFDLEPALAALLVEWLAESGLPARVEIADDADTMSRPPDLLVVDIPFPRQGAPERLRALAAAWPGVPVLALSPTFFAGVAARGAVARQLGVAAVLASPLAREGWLAAVGRLLEAPR